jgi:hypothetical protein
VEGQLGERTREYLGFAKRLRNLKRGARASFGRGNVAGFVLSPGKAPLDLDPQPDVIPHLGERRLEELHADVKALRENSNPGEPGERTGTIASAGRRATISSQRACPLRLACLEVALAASIPFGAPRCELAGEAASLFHSRRRVRAPRAAPSGRPVQLRRHGTVGTGQRARDARPVPPDLREGREAQWSLRRSAAVAFA